MGMFGIIIMVIENELSSAGVYNKEDIMSTGLKTLISISTVVLLVLIVAYHMLEIQVHMGSEAFLAWLNWSRGVATKLTIYRYILILYEIDHDHDRFWFSFTKVRNAP